MGCGQLLYHLTGSNKLYFVEWPIEDLIRSKDDRLLVCAVQRERNVAERVDGFRFSVVGGDRGIEYMFPIQSLSCSW